MTSILWFIAGYCFCVLVPLPGVSRLILDGWARLWAAIKGNPPTTP